MCDFLFQKQNHNYCLFSNLMYNFVNLKNIKTNIGFGIPCKKVKLLKHKDLTNFDIPRINLKYWQTENDFRQDFNNGWKIFINDANVIFWIKPFKGLILLKNYRGDSVILTSSKKDHYKITNPKKHYNKDEEKKFIKSKFKKIFKDDDDDKEEKNNENNQNNVFNDNNFYSINSNIYDNNFYSGNIKQNNSTFYILKEEISAKKLFKFYDNFKLNRGCGPIIIIPDNFVDFDKNIFVKREYIKQKQNF